MSYDHVAYMREWRTRDTNREQARDRQRERHHERKACDPEYVSRRRTYQKTSRARRRDQRNAYNRAWRAAHPDRRRAAEARRRLRHPEKLAYYQARRRARELGASGSFTWTEWLAKMELLGGCCIYCGRSDLPLTLDHKVPLARGGTNSIDNCVPACRPCNSRKGTRTATEFIGVRRG